MEVLSYKGAPSFRYAVVSEPEEDGVARKPTQVRVRRWDGSIADLAGDTRVHVLKRRGQLSLEYMQGLARETESQTLRRLREEQRKP